MGIEEQSPGTVWMRVKRDGKWGNERLEDMTKAEFVDRFDKNSAGFMDHLAQTVRWFEWFLKTEGYETGEKP